jgi:hypothetical protein
MDDVSGRAPSRWSAVTVALACAFGIGAAMFIAERIAHGAMPFPRCTLKWLTDVPCPGCGGTRSLAMLAHGEWSTALAMNPLIVLAAAVGIISVPLTLLDGALCEGKGARSFARWSQTPALWRTLVVALTLNWVWLLFEGR